MADDTQPPESSRRGLSDVQISELVVHGLFGRYDHKVSLPTASEEASLPSVVILYGPNGIGKTTVLRMFDGLMRLDFDVFREVPFVSCHLDFTTGQRLQVSRHKTGLQVTFDSQEVLLNPNLGRKGALHSRDDSKVEHFRQYFFKNVENISFNFIQATRAELFHRREVDSNPDLPDYLLAGNPDYLQAGTSVAAARRLVRERLRRQDTSLANQVKKFIAAAQLDSESFFLTTEPDLFNRIIVDLAQDEVTPKPVAEIRRMFDIVHKQDEDLARLGLRGDRWDYKRVRTMLANQKSARNAYTRTVLSTYANFLASRAQGRQLVADRLLTFEQVMNEFFRETGKTVRVDAASGVVISADGTTLDESQLSSGERQLLYLMVAALTTRRKGTVIAIDEPELSMHLGWQRKLLRNLIRCASNAAPQFMLATHSPDISANYAENMIELSAT
jgi:ABC-type hemin transport system ATPase subunit